MTSRVSLVSVWCLTLSLATTSWSCDAAFEDLRPETQTFTQFDAGSTDRGSDGDRLDVSNDAGEADSVMFDAAGGDAASGDAVGSDSGESDMAEGRDAGEGGDVAADMGRDPTEADLAHDLPTEEPDPAEDRVVLRGVWGGRGGYEAEGTVELIALAAGGYSLRMGDDFSVGRVPGPVVALSTREAIGSALSDAAGDITLGVLTANSGAQSYAAPEAATGAVYAWIYCQPFGVEIARATLEEVPE